MATRFTGVGIRIGDLSGRQGAPIRDLPGRRGSDPCPPPCPACGGLECLCRPRFFAGQLLTEQDLNRLDSYVRAKNRLHNRHLHGWGVVCGLEVTCHDCEDLVRVGSGYALSPCGDDIVVCEDEAVDVCKLIRACDPERRRGRCDPPRRDDPTCRDAEETWVLAVCYHEHASRGVTALRSAGCACDGGGGCGCGGRGGSGGCGCGGHGAGGSHGAANGCGCGGKNGNGNGHGHGATASTGTSRVPPQCEPTVICEGAEYRVWRAPAVVDDDERGGGAQGPLADRVMCCIQPYIDWAAAAGATSGSDAGRVERSRFCCRMKERLRALLVERPVHDCALLARLDAVVCPAPEDQDFDARMDRAGDEVIAVWFQALMSCICSALLPPCPGPWADDCVPLATVTVRRSKGGCRVLRVCNWTVHRKFATSFPALQYWLSVLPFGRYLREVMEDACCGLLDLFGRQEAVVDDANREAAAAGEMRRSTFDPASASADAHDSDPAKDRPSRFGIHDPMPFASGRSRETSTLLASIALGGATPVDPGTLFRSMGRRRKASGDDEGEAPQRRLTELERDHLPQYLLGSRLVPAALAGAAPHDLEALLPGLLNLAGRAGVGAPDRAKAAAAGEEVGELRGQVDELRAAMEAQRRTIEALEKRLDER